MVLQDPGLRSMYDLKVCHHKFKCLPHSTWHFQVFVQCDSDLMLARRIKRDVAERGRKVEGVLEQYLRFVKPAYDNFVLPTSRYADIVCICPYGLYHPTDI